jgi:hypothetical protein
MVHKAAANPKRLAVKQGRIRDFEKDEDLSSREGAGRTLSAM